MLQGGAATVKGDVWSLGVVFWELLEFGKEPFGYALANAIATVAETGKEGGTGKERGYKTG